MLIKKIKAKNFKTYLNLDLDISVDEERPIILIGGVNGGGSKSFDIICVIFGVRLKVAPRMQSKLYKELSFSLMHLKLQLEQ